MIARLMVRVLLATLFLFAGTVHLCKPALFRPVMPPWIPFPFPCIIVSGLFELLGGLGLLVPEPRIQALAGWGLVLLLLAVFPANIYMATAHVKIGDYQPPPWMTWARLPLQPLLIIAVLWAARLTPFKH